MNKTKSLNIQILSSNKELKKLLLKFYDTPSQDELLKLSSMDDLFNMTIRQKELYLNNYNLLKMLTTDDSISRNKIKINERIDYNLTLIKLLSIYNCKINNYELCEYTVDSGNASFTKIKHLFVLLEAFNSVKVSEYSIYDSLFFKREFINSILINIDCSNEANYHKFGIQRIKSRVNYSVNRYSKDYNLYDDENRKKLVKSIISDLWQNRDLIRKID